jgi:hypothetical protein
MPVSRLNFAIRMPDFEFPVLARSVGCVIPADSLLRRDLRNVYSAYGVVTVALVSSIYIY